jgi:hypothetical protein
MFVLVACQKSQPENETIRAKFIAKNCLNTGNYPIYSVNEARKKFEADEYPTFLSTFYSSSGIIIWGLNNQNNFDLSDEEQFYVKNIGESTLSISDTCGEFNAQDEAHLAKYNLEILRLAKLKYKFPQKAR